MPVKPTDAEEQYFIDLELKRRLKDEQKRAAELEAQEKQRLKEIHYMHCPKCGHKLTEQAFADILIDVCANCQGVWLDAGEMDKIMEVKKGFFKSLRSLFD
jgi:hypothetical protein